MFRCSSRARYSIACGFTVAKEIRIDLSWSCFDASKIVDAKYDCNARQEPVKNSGPARGQGPRLIDLMVRWQYSRERNVNSAGRGASDEDQSKRTGEYGADKEPYDR
jgi:hypothetical protein